jgi:uncharacterized low-complexity protein
MTTASTLLKSLLIAAVLAAASAHAADDQTQNTEQRSTTLAKWKVGESKCAVIDGQVRCSLGR